MKQKNFIVALSALLIVFTFQNLSAGGEIESQQRSITVRGTGSVTAAPDIVRLNLGVQSMNKDLSAAIDDNNRRIYSVIDVIKDYEIPDTDYSTSNFSVYYQQPYNSDQSPDDGTYNVNNNIFITIKDIDSIGSFIEDALSAGANQFYGLEYAVSNTDPLLKKARKLAIENAMSLAAETAEMAGVSLGEIISIEETQYYGGAQLYKAEMSMARGSNSLITVPGEKSIETQIMLKIELK